MNLKQLKKNINWHFQLEPAACHVDENNRELNRIDEDWILQEVDQYILISNVKTGHKIEIGTDHVYRFSSNTNRSKKNIKYGFLTLHIQIFIKGEQCWYWPNTKPGEPLSIHRVPINQYIVDHLTNLPESIILVLTDLANQGFWSGTAVEFNRHAANVIYGNDFAKLMPDLIDFFSLFIVNGYISILSLTDHGNRPDGTPVTTFTIELTRKGFGVLKIIQSNPPLQGTPAS